MNVGVLTAGGVSAAGAANVNIINNAVLAEIKSQSKISASSVNVNAVSDMDINILTASAAVGALNVEHLLQLPQSAENLTIVTQMHILKQMMAEIL